VNDSAKAGHSATCSFAPEAHSLAVAHCLELNGHVRTSHRLLTDSILWSLSNYYTIGTMARNGTKANPPYVLEIGEEILAYQSITAQAVTQDKSFEELRLEHERWASKPDDTPKLMVMRERSALAKTHTLRSIRATEDSTIR